MSRDVIEKENIKISVIIPMYNGGDKIRKCLNNFDRQDANIEYEVIIVDDKSTDDSVEKTENIIRELKDPSKCRLIKCEQNGRAGRARNIGVAEALGEYILFADQDDYPDISLLSTLYELSDNGQIDMVSCAAAENSDEVYYRPTLDIRKGFSTEDKIKLFGKYGYVFASLIKRDLLLNNNIYFPENVMFEDALFNDGVLACADSVRTTEKILYYRKGDETSQTFGLNTKKMNDRIDAAMWYLSNYSNNPKLSVYMEGFGVAAMFYVYLSCIRWMITVPELYDKALFDKCLRCAKKIDPDWNTIFKKEHRIKNIYLHILKIIYDKPSMFHLFRAIHGVKRSIRGH